MNTRLAYLSLIFLAAACGDSFEMDTPDGGHLGERRGAESACAGLDGVVGLSYRDASAQSVPGGVDVFVPMVSNDGCTGHLEMTVRPGRGVFANGYRAGTYRSGSEPSQDPATCGFCATLFPSTGPSFVASAWTLQVLSNGVVPGASLYLGLDGAMLGEQGGSRVLRAGGFVSQLVE